MLFINTIPAIATEEENIDSFNVHPANRWDISDNGWDTHVVGDSILNLTDTGDGSTDSYELRRGLRESDAKIEFRFKVLGTSSPNKNDALRIRFRDGGNDGDTNFYLVLYSISDVTTDTRFEFLDVDGVLRIVGITEDFTPDNWYVVKIDINLLKSTIRYRASFDNGTRLFDYSNEEIYTDYIPEIFSRDNLQFQITAISSANNSINKYYLDYVKAPFKERQWTQTDTPGDADYLQDSWDFAHVRDDIDDDSAWSLTVPSLDVVSGSFESEIDDYTNLVSGDNIISFFRVYTVDWDDGDLTNAVVIRMWRGFVPVEGYVATVKVYLDGVEKYTSVDDVSGTDYKIDFVISLERDRSEIKIKGRHWIDKLDEDVYRDFVGIVALSEVSATFSQEFVIETDQTVDFDGNVDYKLMYTEFGFTDRDIFADIVKGVVDPIGNFLSEIFTIAFRFLAGIFRIVGDLITAAISVAVGLIQTSIGLVVGAVEAVGIILADILTAVGELAADIATAVWEGIGDALDFITDAIADIATDIWISFSSVIGDILDDLITALISIASDVAGVMFDVLEFFIVLVLDIVDDFINLVITAIFFIWDLLALPDLIAIYDTVIVGLIQLAVSTPALFIYLLDVWFFWATGVFFLGFLILLGFPIISSSNPGELVNNFVDMNSMDATLGIALLGFQIKIPIGFLFWPVFFLMFLTPLL